MQLTEEQSIALEAVDRWYQRGGGGAMALTGPAGTGKSTIMTEVVARYPTTILSAMTGRAALRLSICTRRMARTLHATLYEPPVIHSGQEEVDGKVVRKRDAEYDQWGMEFAKVRPPVSFDGDGHPSRVDLLVVDEASMMTPRVWDDLQLWIDEGVRVLLVGDDYQLPPVITGPELKRYGEDYSVFSVVPGQRLTTIMRNAGGIVRAGGLVRSSGSVVRVSDDNYQFQSARSPLRHAVDAYIEDREDHCLITWRNAVRMRANQLVRERLGHGGEVPDEGEPVLFKKNSAEYNVTNGDIRSCGGTFEGGPKFDSLQTYWMSLKGSPQRILVSIDGGDRDSDGQWFDGKMPWIENMGRYRAALRDMSKWAPTLKEGDRIGEPVPITWGYVLTAHSAQGSEYRRVTTFLDERDLRWDRFNKETTLPTGGKAKFSARWTYTAITRARELSTMVVG